MLTIPISIFVCRDHDFAEEIRASLDQLLHLWNELDAPDGIEALGAHAATLVPSPFAVESADEGSTGDGDLGPRKRVRTNIFTMDASPAKRQSKGSTTADAADTSRKGGEPNQQAEKRGPGRPKGSRKKPFDLGGGSDDVGGEDQSASVKRLTVAQSLKLNSELQKERAGVPPPACAHAAARLCVAAARLCVACACSRDRLHCIFILVGRENSSEGAAEQDCRLACRGAATGGRREGSRIGKSCPARRASKECREGAQCAYQARKIRHKIESPLADDADAAWALSAWWQQLIVFC